jgi:alanine racemase
MQSAHIEISRRNLIHNIQTFRSLLSPLHSQTRFCAVVKSNAYGHGLQEIVKICLESGQVDLFGVNTLEEATKVRSMQKNIPILVMGDIPNLENRESEWSDPNFWILVSRLSSWKRLAFPKDPNQRPKIHLKVDTGMGRLGTSGTEFQTILSSGKSEGLPLEGIATHFASAEDFTEHSYSRLQLKRFKEAIEIANSLGYKNLVRHAAASAPALLFDEARMDMIRVGISLYGLWPSIETKLSMNILGRPTASLVPVLSWRSQIQHIQEIPTGSYIGYGSTFKTTYPTRVGVVPVGYYEGLDRKLSNNGYMLVNGERARILGRVCMNMSMIDLTHIPEAQVGVPVTIIGQSGKEMVTADDLSAWTNTINYETVTKILDLLPRTVVD